MYTEERKLHLIEDVLKIKSDEVLIAIESILKIYKSKPKKAISLGDFAGIISEEDAAIMKKAIAETCENIDTNEWQ
jgi:hypothetical protein